MNPPSLSIVIPARNEEKYINLAVEKILALSLPIKYEIIFIEGRSTDQTLDEIKKAAVRYGYRADIKYAIQDGVGKADAVWKGFDVAENDLLLILDADLTVDPKEIPAFYNAAIMDSNRLINGSRFIYEMEKGAMRFLNYWANRIFAVLISIIIKKKLTDTLCGTKVIYRGHFESIKKTGLIKSLEDPFCDFSLLLGASYLGLKIVEVPVSYRKRLYGSTKIRRFKDGWKLLKIAIKYLFMPKYDAYKI